MCGDNTPVNEIARIYRTQQKNQTVNQTLDPKRNNGSGFGSWKIKISVSFSIPVFKIFPIAYTIDGGVTKFLEPL